MHTPSSHNARYASGSVVEYLTHTFQEIHTLVLQDMRIVFICQRFTLLTPNATRILSIPRQRTAHIQDEKGNIDPRKFLIAVADLQTHNIGIWAGVVHPRGFILGRTKTVAAPFFSSIRSWMLWTRQPIRLQVHRQSDT